MSKYAKNFMPIMFNLYTADSEDGEAPDHQVLLDTIRDYIQIADSSVGSASSSIVARRHAARPRFRTLTSAIRC